MEIFSCYKQLISEAGFSMSVVEQNNQTSKKIVVTHHLRQKKNKPLGSFLSVPDFQLPILHFDLNVL